MKKITKQQPGFTFVELLFAIVVLGTMFSIAMVVVLNTLRFYVFSNSVRQNQENARNIIDEIDRDVRFGKLVEPIGNGDISHRICVLKPSENRIVLYENYEKKIIKTIYSYITEPANCSSLNSTKFSQLSSTQLNVDRMKVPIFDIVKTQGAETVSNFDAVAVTISMQVLTGTPNADNKCDTEDIYCNSIILNTALSLRGGD